MEFRRHGPHETRRRRLLAEENGQTEEGEVRADEAPARRPRSGSSENLPRVTDLVPRNASTFFLLFVGGLLIVAGLEALYWFMPQFCHLTTDGTIEAFDLDAEGTLAVWFSSFLLTMAGFTALAIYSVRKRHEEDYHARYRVWLWAAMCWFVLSIDETGSLHEGFKELMTWLSGSRLLGDGSLWWVIAYGLVLGQLALMLWIETKGSWGARIALVCTALCFAAAVAAQLELFTSLVGVRIGIMIEEGFEMVGDLCLLLGMGLHARFVARNHASGKRTKAASAKAAAAKSKTKPKRTSSSREREVNEVSKSEKAEKTERPAKPAETRPANEPRPVTATGSTPPSKPAASAPVNKPSASISASTSAPRTAPPAAKPTTLPAKPLLGGSAAAASSGGLRIDAPQSAADGGHRKLSKSERKALRREQRGSRGDAGDDEDE